MKYPFFVVLILSTATAIVSSANLTTVYQWKYLDFVWYNSTQKNEAIASGDYNASQCVPFDVDQPKDGRVFVTLVRDEGVPASLFTVSNQTGDGGPLLDPYPDWTWYKKGNCSGITSVYRVDIKCNHLFVLDCGQMADEQVCPPKLLIFDLANDNLIKSIIIPHNVATNANGTGLLVTPAVYDKYGHCNIESMTVFMADILGYGLVIYNGENGQFCRIESDYMKPTNTNFTINNENFTLNDGILGITLIHMIRERTTYLYYTDLAGLAMYKMDVRKLKCPLTESEADSMTYLEGTLSGQTAPIASKDCALFFSNIPQTSIMCADACQTFNPNNTALIAQNSTELQFPSGMKVRGETLWILTDRLQRIVRNLNLTDINFRILTMEIKEIQKETHCFDSCRYRQGKHKHMHNYWRYKDCENSICYCSKYQGNHSNKSYIWWYSNWYNGPYYTY